MKQAILLLVIVICLAGPVFADRLYTWGSPEPISLNATTKTLHAFEGTDFKFNPNGSFDIIKNGVKYGTVFFGLSGTYQGTAYKRLVSDFNWTVQVLENSPEKISVRAYNNYPAFQWWVDLNIGKYEYFKVSHTIKNNMAKQVTNAKLWYVVVIDQNTLPFALYQKSDCLDANCAFVYDYSTDKSYTSLDTNFAQYYNKVSFLTAGQKPISARFLFADIIKNGFFITNAFFGNLSHLDVFLPDANGFALAFSKGAQTIPSGATVVIDPTVTAADALEGHIQYQGASYKAVDATSIIAGHLGASSKYNWYRPILSFDITGLGVVNDANLYLAYASKAIVSETCTFDLNSITTIGAAIDSADWATTTFETTKNNWFDQTIAANISNPVISAWNGAVGASRTYVDFRIGMDNEPTYTGTSNDCQVTFTDIGNAGAQSYISYMPAISVDVNYPENGQSIYSNTTIDVNFNVISLVTAPSILFDVNYSSSQTEGTGTVIINDGNVASTPGLRCDSNTLTTQQRCTYRWPQSLVSGNYYILIKAVSSDGNTSFSAGASTFTIILVPLTVNVYYPEDREYLQNGAFTDINFILTSSYFAPSILIDINYSTKKTDGTGTIIINDGNVALTPNLFCDSNTITSNTTCTYRDWNISASGEYNYYILIKAVSSDGNTSFSNSYEYFTVGQTCTGEWKWGSIGPVNGLWAPYPKTFNDEIYFGFSNQTDINGIANCDNICKYNDDKNVWSSIGPLSAGIDSMVVYNDVNLYFAGDFKDANGIADSNRFAKWRDINAWAKVSGATTSNGFDDMVIYDENIFVLGSFSNFAGVTGANNIIRLSNTLWSRVGASASLNQQTYSGIVYHKKLYVGGNFTKGGGINDANRIIVWDNYTNQWGTIGPLNAAVNEVLVYSDELWVAGEFTDGNGISSCDYLCVYSDNTKSWRSVGAMPGEVDTMGVFNNRVWVSGSWKDANGISSCDGLCAWTGTNWDGTQGPLNSGGALAYGMELYHNKYYFIGGFTDQNGNANADGITYLYCNPTTVAPPVSTYDFTVAFPSNCTGLQGKSTAGNGACDRCWAQPTDSLPPIDSSDLNCQGQNVGSGIPFLLFDFTGSATTYDLNMDLNVAPTTGLSALVKCDSGDSTGAVTLTASPQVVCDGIAGDHNIFMWLKFTNYSVANGLFSTRRADVNASA